MNSYNLTYESDTSHKFWNARRNGSTISIHFGRVGTRGQTRVIEFESEQEAKKELEKRAASKRRKGYKDVQPGPSGPTVDDILNRLDDVWRSGYLKLGVDGRTRDARATVIRTHDNWWVIFEMLGDVGLAEDFGEIQNHLTVVGASTVFWYVPKSLACEQGMRECGWGSMNLSDADFRQSALDEGFEEADLDFSLPWARVSEFQIRLPDGLRVVRPSEDDYASIGLKVDGTHFASNVTLSEDTVLALSMAQFGDTLWVENPVTHLQESAEFSEIDQDSSITAAWAEAGTAVETVSIDAAQLQSEPPSVHFGICRLAQALSDGDLAVLETANEAASGGLNTEPQAFKDSPNDVPLLRFDSTTKTFQRLGRELTAAEIAQIRFVEVVDPRDLSFCKYLPYMVKLGVYGRQPYDTGPLVNHPTLQSFSSNTLRHLDDLTTLNLWYLDISDCAVTDFSPIVRLPRLQDLILDNTAVSSLTCIEGLPQLRDLRVQGTKVTDLTPLLELNGLGRVLLDYSAVADISPLAGHHNLWQVSLRETQVTDLSPLANLKNLTSLVVPASAVASLGVLRGLSGLTVGVPKMQRSKARELLSGIGVTVTSSN